MAAAAEEMLTKLDAGIDKGTEEFVWPLQPSAAARPDEAESVVEKVRGLDTCQQRGLQRSARALAQSGLDAAVSSLHPSLKGNAEVVALVKAAFMRESYHDSVKHALETSEKLHMVYEVLDPKLVEAIAVDETLIAGLCELLTSMKAEAAAKHIQKLLEQAYEKHVGNITKSLREVVRNNPESKSLWSISEGLAILRDYVSGQAWRVRALCDPVNPQEEQLWERLQFEAGADLGEVVEDLNQSVSEQEKVAHGCLPEYLLESTKTEIRQEWRRQEFFTGVAAWLSANEMRAPTAESMEEEQVVECTFGSNTGVLKPTGAPQSSGSAMKGSAPMAADIALKQSQKRKSTGEGALPSDTKLAKAAKSGEDARVTQESKLTLSDVFNNPLSKKAGSCVEVVVLAVHGGDKIFSATIADQTGLAQVMARGSAIETLRGMLPAAHGAVNESDVLRITGFKVRVSQGLPRKNIRLEVTEDSSIVKLLPSERAEVNFDPWHSDHQCFLTCFEKLAGLKGPVVVQASGIVAEILSTGGGGPSKQPITSFDLQDAEGQTIKIVACGRLADSEEITEGCELGFFNLKLLPAKSGQGESTLWLFDDAYVVRGRAQVAMKKERKKIAFANA